MGGDLKKFLEHKTSHFYSIISPEKMKHLSLQTKIFLFWPDGPLNIISEEFCVRRALIRNELTN